ncbi:hypothetical protein Q31b_40710 [Novipirellula aureliae]|uniref:Thioredoxin domain-containing protein n=2 Tax=Novipirellula aureliae TaxID=2527966 RepID=A0A5C6DQS5_9BACT|nr:hypothetical protein Q31b_40710 [Novipirellula aureliae]
MMRMMSQHKKICLQSSLLMIFVSLAGCNSDPTEPSVVAPPDSSSPLDEGTGQSSSVPTALPNHTESSGELDVPGKLELPAGAIPDPDAEPSSATEAEPPSGSGGLEMPSDADVSKSEVSQPNVSAARQTIGYAEWKEIEQKVTSSNQLTVVDIWSLSCQPCLEEFPGLVRLHRELGEQVSCISVNVDFDGRKTRPADYYEDRVAAFLAEVGATFPTYISETASDDIFSELDLASIPAVLIYDAEGNLIKRFVDVGDTVGFSYDADVIPFIKPFAK